MSARSGQLRGSGQVRPKRYISASRLIVSITVIVIFAAGIGAGYTRTGERIAAATQRFLTFYSGVFALVALTMAVAAGLIATDRIFMSIGNRIVAQAVHRALAFVSVAFLITHIAMEVLIGKSTVIDSVVPFLSHWRLFYVGLGTIGSDMMILLIATGIARRRFAEKSTPFKWRIMHGSAYVAWPISIVHSLLAGRHAKPYVDWSYGACLLLVGIALVMRSVATVRPRQASAQPWPDEAGSASPTAASMAAQAFLLHSQRMAAAAGLSAGQPAGLAAVPAGQPMSWPGGAQPSWQATPATGLPALPGRVSHTPAAGIPVVPGSVAHTPAAGMPSVPQYQGADHTPAAGMPVVPGPAAHTPAAGMPSVPPREYQAPPVGVWPVPMAASSPPAQYGSMTGGAAPASPAETQYQPPPAVQYEPPSAMQYHLPAGMRYRRAPAASPAPHYQDPVATGMHYQDPPGEAARDARPPAEYEALPYQVQALYPATYPATGDLYPAPDDQAGWAQR